MYNTILEKLHLGFLKFDAADGSHDPQLVEKGKRLLAQSRRHHRNRRKRGGLHSAAEAAQMGINNSVNSSANDGGSRGGGSKGGGWLSWGGSGRGAVEGAGEEESVVANGAYDYDDYGEYDQNQEEGMGGGGGSEDGDGEVNIDSLLSPLLNGNVEGIGDDYEDGGSGRSGMLEADARLIDGSSR